MWVEHRVANELSRMDLVLCGVLTTIAVCSCGGASQAPDQLPDAAGPGSATCPGYLESAEADAGDSGPTSAPHEVLQYPIDGPVIAHPRLVTITFADYPERSTMESFGDFIVTSSWLASVGADYGVEQGTNTNVELSMDAPDSIDDEGIQELLENLMAMHVMPAQPQNEPPQFIYMIYFPSHTTITFANDLTLCVDDSSTAYHNNVDTIVYAVIPTCYSSQADGIEAPASHEFIESATDPLLTNIEDAEPLTGYGTGNSLEVADLCGDLPPISEATFTLVSVWSNSAALAGTCPCVPATTACYGVSAQPCLEPVAPGGSYSFAIEGWSTASSLQWEISAQPIPVSPFYSTTFTPVLTWGPLQLANGESTSLTVTVPLGTPPGSAYSTLIQASAATGSFLPFAVGVYVPDH